MAKKGRKQYSAEQKYKYHEKRKNDTSATENQRIYSSYWVSGFRDPHAEENLSAAQEAFKRNKKYFKRSDNAVYAGSINGRKVAISDPSASRKAYREYVNELAKEK